MPLTGSIERAMQGLPPFAWEPEKGNQIGVMPRRGKVEDIRWFQNDASFVFHPMNAFNEGDVITCDVAEYEQAPLFPNPDGSAGDPSKMWAKLNRWTFDLASNTDDYQVEQLDDAASEFGRLDERHACQNYRYGYMLRQEAGDGSVDFSNIAKFDHQTGTTDTYKMEDKMASGEAIFVPKSSDAAEGVGYLLSNVYDKSNDKSHLLILDAESPSAGPLARAFLDHRVPFGFHGNWRPGQESA
jgi:carotenoid cleavage dioxygenase